MFAADASGTSCRRCQLLRLFPHALLCKAPACTVGEMAEAALKGGAKASGLTQATKVDKNHSERNAHRLFNRYGLALRVPISYLIGPGGGPEAEALEVPYLKVSDFLSLLLRKYEEVAVGGLKLGPQSEELCASFGHKFQGDHLQRIMFSKLTEATKAGPCKCPQSLCVRLKSLGVSLLTF